MGGCALRWAWAGTVLVTFWLAGCDGGTPLDDTGPALIDSDGDGFHDAAELAAGCDPLAAEGPDYESGWPSNEQKSSLEDPGYEQAGAVGRTHPRFCGLDPAGDLVDLYDFGGQGVPVVIDVSTLWCEPCQRVTEWLEDGDPQHLSQGQDPETGATIYYPWYTEGLADLPARVQSGEVMWITLLVQDMAGNAPTTDTLAAWSSAFPSERVPVLLDDAQRMDLWLSGSGYPILNLLDSEMRFLTWSQRGPEAAFEELDENR